MHEHDSRSFQFTIADELQLMGLVNHCRKVIDEGSLNAGINLSAPEYIEEKNKRVNSNKMEHYFGFSRKMTNVISNEVKSTLKSAEPLKINLEQEVSQKLFNSG